MANVVEEMVGTREAEAAAMATESGGAVATEFGGAATTGDATAGDERDGGDRWSNVYGRRGVRI